MKNKISLKIGGINTLINLCSWILLIMFSKQTNTLTIVALSIAVFLGGILSLIGIWFSIKEIREKRISLFHFFFSLFLNSLLPMFILFLIAVNFNDALKLFV